jgi:hypothetical protein
MRPGRKAWTEDEDAFLRLLIRKGLSTERVAELIGRSVRAIYNRVHMKRLILRQNKRSGMTDEQFRMNLRRLGVSRQEQRDELGQFSKSTVLTPR